MSDLKSVSGGIQVQSATPTDYVVPTPPSSVGVFFWDDFASGDESKTMNGFNWGVGRPVISSDNPYTGNYSMRFKYTGDAPTNGENNEQNFHLGAEYNELYIKFMLYLPDGTEPWGGAAYIRELDGANHKLLRLWGNWPYESGHDGYGLGETMGASTHPAGSVPLAASSKTSSDMSLPNNTGLITYQDNPYLFANDDRGKWTEFVIGTKNSTHATDANAFLKIWKNGVLTINIDGLNNWSAETDRPDAIRTDGYLFGAANGGFADITYMFIDNIVFSTNFIT